MSSGIGRVHGRTLLQNYLCRNVFHRGSENSVFNVTYNFNGGNICGGGFWGGFAGGMGMGLGAGLMSMLGTWMGGFGNMFSGFPMMGNFNCFGGGYPMMNWWGGGAGGNNSSTTTAGGSRVYNNNTTIKERKINYDREVIDGYEDEVKKLLTKHRNGETVSPEEFNKAYIDVTKHTLRDNKNTRTDKRRLKNLRKDLEELAVKTGLKIPTDKEIKGAEIKEKDNTPKIENPVQPEQINGQKQLVTPTVTPADADTLIDKINKADDIDGLFRLLGDRDYNDLLGDEKVEFDKRFRTILSIIKTDPAKLSIVREKIKGKEDLENIYNEVIGEPEEEPEEVKLPDKIRNEFNRLELSDGQKLTDEEILILNEIGEVAIIDGITSFKPSKGKITLKGMEILQDKQIPVAFANNKKAEVDQWIVGKVTDLKENKNGDDYDGYTINCQGFGKFGLEFKVKKISDKKYNITCNSESHDSNYDHVYAANGGCIYHLDGGILNFDKTNIVETLISRYKKSGYTEIPKKVKKVKQ